MPERPFLYFSPPTFADKKPLNGRGHRYTRPSADQQRERLENKFQQITQSFIGLQASIAGAEPEQVIVLETLTDSVETVADAASRIAGLEWLSDLDLGEVEPQDGFVDANKPERKLPKRLYALFTNQQAMTSLLGIWHGWTKEPGKRAARGFGPFKRLFQNLSDIRRWSPKDRIAETGILEAWKEDIEVKGLQGTSRFEVELWYRADPIRRQALLQGLRSRIQEASGQEISSCLIEDIRYHALLVELPSAYIQSLLQQLQQQEYVRLLLAEGVMFFRPQSQSTITISQPQPVDIGTKLQNRAQSAGSPIAAIFDGVPLANHVALAGRLIVDDPDDHSSLYQPSQQVHGTAMASTVLFGDLNGTADPLTRPVYIRPIFQPDGYQGKTENTPPNRLVVDLVHRAVRRMMEGEQGEEPAAPTVRVVNLSLGDRCRPFDRDMSPLARLIDWLSWTYRLLFIVSAGNCQSDVAIAVSDQEWAALSPADRTSAVLRAMHASQYQRRVLSPAEAINAITVGASHKDECQNFEVGNRVNLLDTMGAPSPATTIGSGFRRSIKPEILMPGGRQLHRKVLGNSESQVFRPVEMITSPGHLAAIPGNVGMELNRFGYSCGTSNSAALATRLAAAAYERLDPSRTFEDQYWAVILKALLVHASSWGQAAELIHTALNLDGRDWQEQIRIKHQFLGYGEVLTDRCLAASDQRATIIGWGEIADNEALVFSLPLAPSLSAVTEYRRLTTTLSWLTECNYKHCNYRRSHLYLSVSNDELGTKMMGVDQKSAQRGTVEHRIFAGSDAKAFLDDANLEIQVNCRAGAGVINEPVPFALIVSLEVEATSNISVYDEVEARLASLVQIMA